MKRDPLLWAALAAVLVVLASAEYELAVACGFGTYVAAGVPAALDVYVLAALRARRDVFTVVLTLIAVNAASHLVEVGLLPVSVPLVVGVSAIAPLVLWRVHRLSETSDPSGSLAAPEPSVVPAEPVPAVAQPAEPITVDRVSEPVDTVPAGPLLGPWTPVAELRAGTGSDLLGDHFRGAAKVTSEPVAEPTPEPSSASSTATGTGAEDIETVDSSNTTFAARVATVRHWLQGEPELTGTEIGTRLGVSDGYGRRLLRTARESAQITSTEGKQA